MGVPARNAVYECDAVGYERMILLILADHSSSKSSPFLAWPGVARIAHCARLSERQTRRYLGQLVARGVIERYKIDRYKWGYSMNLPDVTVDDTPEITDVTHVVMPDVAEVTVDDIPQYPYGVTTVVTPQRSGVSSGYSGVSSGYSGVSSGVALIRNERIERIEREENDTRVRVREEHEDEPHSSADIWNQIINLITENREDLNGYSADLAEIERWKRLFRHEAPAYMRLKLRGPADLAKSPRVKAMIYAAASRLYDARMVVEFQWW